MTHLLQRSVPILLFIFLLQASIVSAATEEYIIVFQDQEAIEQLKTLNVDIVEEFSFFPGVVIQASDQVIHELEDWPTVKSIEPNQEVALDYSTYPNWGIDHLNIPSAWNAGYTGKGVKVAVIDSGIATHPALRIAGGVSMVDYTTSYYDDNGHGTHSAGIIAARHASSGHYGVAYGVQLYAVKSLDASGNGRLNDTIRGIEWAVKHDMDIVNLSLGTTSFSHSLKAAVDSASAQDVLIVAAAGNTADQPVEYPARFESVIAVSAVDERNRFARFSASGPEIDFAAPGVDIHSTFLNNTYHKMSGTSMAAPFVSGTLALYMEAYPELNAKEIRKMAEENALPFSNRNQYGHGLIQPPKPRPEPEPTEEVLPAPHSLAGQVVSSNTDNSVQYSLTWKHDQLDKVSSYKVYRDGKLLKTVNKPSFKETLQVGDFKYTVIAIGQNGTESMMSLPFSVKIEAKPKPIDDHNSGITFKDVNHSFWASPSIMYLAEARIISGYNDGTFAPNAPVRRGQAMAMIANALNWDTANKETTFTDVNEDYFAAGAIATAVEKGIISGFADGTFRPNAPITRAQMAAILGQAFNFNNNSSTSFVDVTETTTGYREIRRMAGLGIVSGYENGQYYRPNQPLSRAQFSVILSRVLNEDFRIKE